LQITALVLQLMADAVELVDVDRSDAVGPVPPKFPLTEPPPPDSPPVDVAWPVAPPVEASLPPAFALPLVPPEVVGLTVWPLPPQAATKMAVRANAGMRIGE